MAAGEEIVRASVAAGGVLSGEHGIGLEKRDYMPLHVLRRRPRCPGPLRRGLRSRRRGQPAQGAARVAAGAATCSTCRPARGSDGLRRGGRPGGTGDLRRRAHAVGRRWRGARRGRARCAPRPASRRVRARGDDRALRGGHARHRAPGRAGRAWVRWWRCPEWPGATVGGVLAVGRSGILRLGRGPVRDTLLQARVRHRGGDGGQGGRPDGEERERLRPLPPAGRLARHARRSSAT